MSARVDVVVVNWNAGELLRKCVESVSTDKAGFEARVIVVDNASSDESMSNIPGSVTKIYQSENAGFARACNIGAAAGTAPYILFLNPDAALRGDCLEASIGFLESAEGRNVGICGVRLVNDNGAVERTCARFPTVRTFVGRALGIWRIWPTLFPPHYLIDFDHAESREVDEVMGAYFLVRRSVFEALNGFDECYFVYFEELDFSLRAKQAGWISYFLATAEAYHKGGGVSSQVKAHRLFYSLRSRIIYSVKNMGWFRGVLVCLITLLLEPLTRIAQALVRRSWMDFRNTLAGYRMLFMAMPRTIAALAGKNAKSAGRID